MLKTMFKIEKNQIKSNQIKKGLKYHIGKGRKIEVNLKGKPTKHQEAVHAGIAVKSD